jgi:tetratricopeptide (TPR) repeat protein
VIAVIVIFISIRQTAFVQNNETLSRFAKISWSNVSDQARQIVWPMALKGFEEKPVLGWGQEGFSYVFNKYYDPRMYGQESWFDRAHNAPLDFLIAGGILGLLSYLSLFGSVLYLLWLRKNNINITERAILTGLLAGYLFQAIFVFDNLISYVMFFTTLAYVHSRITDTALETIVPDKHHKKNHKESERVQGYISVFVQNEEYQNYILIPAVVILTTFTVWWVNIPSINANQTLIQSLSLVRDGRVTEGIKGFKTALAYKSMGDSEIREQLLANTVDVIKMPEISQEIKKEFLNLAVNEIENQIAIVPEDARYYILVASLLNMIGASEQAMPYINKAIELSPLKQMMRFQLIQALFALGKSEEAMKEAKAAYELDKRYDQAKQFYIETIKNEIMDNPQFRVEGEKIIKSLSTTTPAVK